MLSDCLTHDAIAVYEFQKIITHYLNENFQPRKMIYFTDGAAQHFNSKICLKLKNEAQIIF